MAAQEEGRFCKNGSCTYVDICPATSGQHECFTCFDSEPVKHDELEEE